MCVSAWKVPTFTLRARVCVCVDGIAAAAHLVATLAFLPLSNIHSLTALVKRLPTYS